ncbi:MAG: T9SS type A sorting domain-containing protein [Owenweeksia sp.]
MPLDTLGVQLDAKPYFVGIRQTNKIPITIGFDRNNTGRSEIFYGQDNNLFPSFVVGTLMMRPFFRYAPNDIGLEEQIIETVDFRVYPNPSTDGNLYVSIPTADPNDIFNYRLFSISGQMMLEGELTGNHISASQLKAGVYLLQLSPADGQKQPGFQKVVISR